MVDRPPTPIPRLHTHGQEERQLASSTSLQSSQPLHFHMTPLPTPTPPSLLRRTSSAEHYTRHLRSRSYSNSYQHEQVQIAHHSHNDATFYNEATLSSPGHYASPTQRIRHHRRLSSASASSFSSSLPLTSSLSTLSETMSEPLELPLTETDLGSFGVSPPPKYHSCLQRAQSEELGVVYNKTMTQSNLMRKDTPRPFGAATLEDLTGREWQGRKRRKTPSTVAEERTWVILE
ncbi:uncharacterized protein L203_103535 [Cryptococcus depauperatus CBS 7841]|uniref:Uncharacterized protein n=1 Tax=Cryptococcus depauperatus CBS 7841 TaxID=1295531 RepID=A0A1E3IKN0_9TREE|nr:hypothetical protein L203_02870 [Cryptococcus depauperatus CBS 7841]